MAIHLPPLPAMLAVLLCAGLFVLLFQYLFPRPAQWRLVVAAVGSGIVATLILAEILRRFVQPGFAGFEGITGVTDALPFAILRAGLPEEATKAIGTLIALVPFWRRATPAEAFQAALFVAVGFAIVENQGYANAFGDMAVLIAFGRGFMATLTHTLLAMIFAAFLMRFVVGGWRQWHLVAIGYLAAVACHSLYDAGLLPILVEYMRGMQAGNMTDIDVGTLLAAVPMVIVGVLLVLVCGLWSLRNAVRRAAAEDGITTEPHHEATVRRWRWSANTLLVLGALGLIGAVAWAILSEPAAAVASEVQASDLQGALIGAIGIVGSFFMIILSWVLRQKR